MYKTTDNYKTDDVEIDKKYILDCKPSQRLFPDDEFSLGSVTSQAIELKLYKTAVPEIISKVYIISGITEEEVPIGYFNVDDISKDDDYTVTLKLLDNMIKFEFNYDGSELVNKKGYAEIIEVLQDMCLKAGVELRFYFFFKYA